jgi:hypothetical protein
MEETKMLSVSADGLITSCETLNNAIRARYPLAPPCPTEEYKIAIKKMRLKNSISGIFQYLNDYMES